MHLITQQTMADKNNTHVVRSRLRAVSRRMGFPDVRMERIQIVASELMSNQIKFAGGAGFIQIWEHSLPEPALDLFALDFGPGIGNLSLAMTDGYSTAGTLGKGLGSIHRASDLSDIYTRPAAPGLRQWCGTAIWVRFRTPHSTHRIVPPEIRTGGFLRALRDNLLNGDSLSGQGNQRFFNWVHLDGLGHGSSAAVTSESLHGLPSPGQDPVEILTILNRRLAGTRGAMGLAVRMDMHKKTADYAGIGDLSLSCHKGQKKLQPRFPGGVLGRAPGWPGTGSFTLDNDTLLFSSSDGIRQNPGLEDFPGLLSCHPQLIAYVTGNLMGRDGDDKSLALVLCRKPETIQP
ncbi:SpoIIE family protein phosphatase [Desulfobotulus sp. H1]|uniref:SpoIIE family protein phosphatase n=1 Tax=Desulfobotulus pelophilus TaxID=2823377 RepID=A0ABT3N5Q5_9BACT|nr:SpoIIE family protein phosphatase [Desulfobotulus pelophilus]MCW7752793.1 SpoIIE family protein phosphatase [Desulfobotulus pelophilus]